MDLTVNIPTLVTLGIAIVGAIVWLIRLEGRVDKNTATAEEVSKAVSALEALVNLTREQFHEYKLQAAREYTTHAVVNEIKRDIITELGRMEQRVEIQINRIVEAQK